MCSPVNAYQETVKRFVRLSHTDILPRTGAGYRDGVYVIEYFNDKYCIDESGRVFRADSPAAEVPFNDRTLILQYLCEASGLPPRGRWLSFLELPDGAHHYAPFQTDAINPLARTLGDHPDEFKLAALRYGGKQLDLGDISFMIPALPKLPLAVVLWEGDDEFPARANILFDSVAETHLTTAALWVLGVELARKILSFYDQAAGEKYAVTWLEGKTK